MSISVKTREIEQAGEKIVIQILEMGDEECMTVADAAEMLDVSPGAIRKDIHDHGLVVTKCNDQNLDSLKKLGVLPFKTTVANLLPQATVQALVKIVNTPEAWAAYNTLWVRQSGTAEIEALKLQIENMSLSYAQKIEAVEAMKQRYEDLGLRFTDSVGPWSGSIRFILADIKTRFFDREHKNKFTWKDLPARDFPLLMKHIQVWEPTGTSQRQLLRGGFVKDPAN